jgi:hypothetical protein
LHLILFERLNALSKFSKFSPPRPAPQISSPTESRAIRPGVRKGMDFAIWIRRRIREDE